MDRLIPATVFISYQPSPTDRDNVARFRRAAQSGSDATLLRNGFGLLAGSASHHSSLLEQADGQVMAACARHKSWEGCYIYLHGIRQFHDEGLTCCVASCTETHTGKSATMVTGHRGNCLAYSRNTISRRRVLLMMATCSSPSDQMKGRRQYQSLTCRTTAKLHCSHQPFFSRRVPLHVRDLVSCSGHGT